MRRMPPGLQVSWVMIVHADLSRSGCDLAEGMEWSCESEAPPLARGKTGCTVAMDPTSTPRKVMLFSDGEETSGYLPALASYKMDGMS